MSLFGKIAAALRPAAGPQPGREPGRNEPCWCGSGEKYKRCHLETDRRRAQARRTTRCASS